MARKKPELPAPLKTNSRKWSGESALNVACSTSSGRYAAG